MHKHKNWTRKKDNQCFKAPSIVADSGTGLKKIINKIKSN